MLNKKLLLELMALEVKNARAMNELLIEIGADKNIIRLHGTFVDAMTKSLEKFRRALENDYT